MAFKRINQLSESTSAKSEDYIAIDSANEIQTKKIKKENFLKDYIKDAPNDDVTKNWIFARKNGEWYRIYPEEYLQEVQNEKDKAISEINSLINEQVKKLEKFIPTGGNIGDVLTKTGSEDYETSWRAPTGGSLPSAEDFTF